MKYIKTTIYSVEKVTIKEILSNYKKHKYALMFENKNEEPFYPSYDWLYLQRGNKKMGVLTEELDARKSNYITQKVCFIED